MERSKPPLELMEIIALTPSFEEFKDELAYLNSDTVRKCGENYGIVKTFCPTEFDPMDPEMKTLSSLMKSMPVLEQTMVRLPLPGKRGKANLQVYNVERRQDKPYWTDANEFMRIGLKQYDATIKAANKKYGKAKFEAMSLRDKFWATREIQKCAAYGADISGSLMKEGLEHWNFNSKNFPCLTRRYTSHRTPGVYSPYLYVGNWGTSFALHIEDHDLYSVNYLHEGEAKVWYSIPEQFADEVEELAAELSKTEADLCPNFLRHKTLMIHPDVFLERGIPVYTTEQLEGEMIITFPKAYHFGFNSGFNIAEARNIATKDWIPVGLRVQKCKCPDSVSPVIERKRLLEMAVEAYDKDLAKLKELTPDELDYCNQLLRKKMMKRGSVNSADGLSSSEGIPQSVKKSKTIGEAILPA